MIFTSPWAVALSAMFIWWFSTGILLMRVRYADNRGPDAHMASVVLGLPLLFGGIFGYVQTLADMSVGGVYLAFLSALSVWAWIELAFLSGVITGPNTGPCPRFASEGERFLRAIGAIAWHECLLIVVLSGMALQAQGAANLFGLWTFLVLFIARISAKLNLFFGVPHINTEFLPSAISHISTYFRQSRMNGLFPLSVTFLTFATGCWVERALASADVGRSVGFWLLAALTALALLEHWFMVLRLQDQKLWRWMMPAPRVVPHESALSRPALTDESTHGL